MIRKMKQFSKAILKYSSMAKNNLAILLFVLFVPLLNFILNQEVLYILLFIFIFSLVCYLLRDQKLILIKIFLLLVIITTIAQYSYPKRIDPGDYIISGRIVSQEDSYFDIRVNVLDNQIIRSPLRVRIYDELEECNVWNDVALKAKILNPTSARNPGQFSQKDYLFSIGIVALSYDIEILYTKESSSLIRKIYSTRNMILNRINFLPEKEASFVKAMLLGDRSSLDKDLRDNYQRVGVSHFLVVSGLHLAIVLMIFRKVLSTIYLKNIYRKIIELSFVWFFAMIVGMHFSIIRASIMASIVIILDKRKMNNLNKLFIAAIVILSFNPYGLNNSGLLLSFGATFAVLTLGKSLAELSKSNVIKAFWIVFAVQIITLPIIANSFNTYNFMSIPANLTLSLLTIPIILLSILALMPVVRFIMYPALLVLVNLHIFIVDNFSSINKSLFFIKEFSNLVFFAYLAVIILLYYYVYKKKRIKAMICIIMVFAIVVVNNNIHQTKIVFFDVKHGDAALIITRCGQKVLVDVGDAYNSFDAGKQIILPYLRQQGIKKLDIIIISHAHKDHFAGAISLLQEVQVSKIYMTEQAKSRNLKEMKELLDLCNEKEIEIYFPEKGEYKILSKNLSMEVIFPKKNRCKEDSNDNSLVIKFFIDGLYVLFTGDIEKDAEEAIVMDSTNNMNVDILKVPHHGSITSSSEEFIDLVQPKIAINSSGSNLFNNFPSKDVILRYNERGIDLYRTDIHGAILISKYKDRFKITKYYSEEGEIDCLSQQWIYCGN